MKVGGILELYCGHVVVRGIHNARQIPPLVLCDTRISNDVQPDLYLYDVVGIAPENKGLLTIYVETRGE